MTEVTRFPHYRQPENIVTNHIMVMLRIIYDASPNLLEALLQAICADDIKLGPRFSQQIAGSHSVPDGLILQRPLAVFVETKLSSGVNSDQLRRHCQTIINRLPGHAGSILISLTTNRDGNEVIPKKVMAIAEKYGIKLVSTTFADLVTQLNQLTTSQFALQETIKEFSDFIFAQHLVPRVDQVMVAVLTGTSWRENLKFGVYYEPEERNPKWQKAAFLGLYHNKCVSHVGRIVTAVAVATDDNGTLAFDRAEFGSVDDACKKALQDIIEAAQTYYPGFQNFRHRYYIVDKFSATDFRKTSPGGMMSHGYFDIEEFSTKKLPSDASGLIAAQALDGHTFA